MRPTRTLPGPTARLFAAALAGSAWLVLLLTGHAAGGVVHLLLVAGLVLPPWRAGAAPLAEDR
jgi:hypothetical protein